MNLIDLHEPPKTCNECGLTPVVAHVNRLIKVRGEDITLSVWRLHPIVLNILH